MTLTQKCLLGSRFDVCVHLHNKAQLKIHEICAGNQIKRDENGICRERRNAQAFGFGSNVPKKG
ncbi:hypothetical protein [Sphingorhabdus sp.]|uniref:hypothetical protein n=1 Tax=Sphingorhabdus sp. TaxID=1902408 RepID=UPI003340A115